MTSHENEFDLGHDFQITKTSRRASEGGTWVSGTLNGHRFDALVFPEHAESSEYELNESRISKLWIQRLADKATTFNWDRGMDVPAADETTKAIVGFLEVGLADLIYAE